MDSPSISNPAQEFFSDTARPDHELYEHPSRISYSCDSCGKTYLTPHHLASHGQSCDASKRKLDQMLQDSKAFWEMRKKRRLQRHTPSSLNAQSQMETNAAQAVQPAPPCKAVPANDPSIRLLDIVEQDVSQSVSPSSDLEHGQASVMPAAPTPDSATPDVHPPADLDVPVAQRKARRERRLPKRFRQEDDLPPTPSPVSQQVSSEGLGQTEQESDVTSPPSTQTAKPTQPAGIETRPLVPHYSRRNVFGILRTYHLPAKIKLTHDPEQGSTLQSQSDIPRKVAKPTYGPFKSPSAFSLADWYWNSTNKSFLDFQKLIAIFKQPGFSLTDIVDVNWRTTFKSLGANESDLAESEDASWISDDGWTTSPINIDIPFHKQMKDNKGTLVSHCVGQFRHRRIVSVIKEKILNREDSRDFHYAPYRPTWKPTEDSSEVELYGEMYASRAFNSAHEEVQRLSSTEANRGLERVVVALMLWSDATQLTNFGPASLWPCYLFFGNESKYRRCQPSERLANQIAYFQKLPDTFYDYLKGRNNGKIPYDGLIAYCIREAYHQQWSILLDEELRDAMLHGICLHCPDGVERCFYPRIFTYSADYPEKVLLAGIRNNGLSPCHRCLVPKADLSKLGAPGDVERDTPREESSIIELVDKARCEIMDNGYAVDSKSKVEVLLKPHSLVPSKDAFHNFVGHSFDIRRALVVDLMHEFEIGAWKKVFIHAVRLLEFFTTTTAMLTAALDERYRATPSFGRDSIRKFGLNASDMKRKAARDFADLLQCAIPAFESLLPEPHNTTFMELLFVCAQWHALAKLRMHNDFTVDFLEYATKLLGSHMRHFSQQVCSKIPTKELAKEAEARVRKEGKASGKSSKKAAKLAVFTIKFHFLGDYVSTIREFGTTDSYSTETGELAHRLPKSWYPRTDKRDFEVQMSQVERRQARLDKIRSDNALDASKPAPPREAPLEPSPGQRYVIARSQDSPLDLSVFSDTPGWHHARDAYTKDLIPKLKRHLLPRILEKLGYNPDSTPQTEYCNVVLSGDRMYRHRLLRINYTTYDVRRNEDVIHIDTPQCNVMLLNREYGPRTWDSEHPYLYGRCLGVYHANVSFVGCLPDGTRCYTEHRLDFVWIHWYEHLPADRPFTLDRLSFAPPDAPTAVGFVDPDDILRGVHIIPQFALGEADVQIRSKWVSNSQKQYKRYYINRFADRDLFMRYQYGMSVGHTYMHRGNFPPPKVPQLAENFNYWDGAAEGEDEDEDPEDLEDPESETGPGASTDDNVDAAQDSASGGGSSSLHYNTLEMDDREERFYLEMYDL